MSPADLERYTKVKQFLLLHACIEFVEDPGPPRVELEHGADFTRAVLKGPDFESCVDAIDI